MSTIKEKHLNNWNHKLHYKSNKYPTCQCGGCPNFFFNALFIGSRGQGKTYSTCQLIKHYEKNIILDDEDNKRQIKTFLISPTIEANQVFTSLSSLDLEKNAYPEYSDEILKGIIDEIKETKKESEEYAFYVKAYKEFIKLDENELYKLDDEYLRILAIEDFKPPSEIKQPEFKFPPINFIILDDLLGSSCMSNKKTSYFQKMLIQNRHNQINFLILIQSIKSIPKTVRLNSSIFWIGKFANLSKVIEDIHSEVSEIKEEDFLKMYLYAISNLYGSLIIDLTGKKKKFLLNWDTELSIQ